MQFSLVFLNAGPFIDSPGIFLELGSKMLSRFIIVDTVKSDCYFCTSIGGVHLINLSWFNDLKNFSFQGEFYAIHLFQIMYWNKVLLF